MGQGYFTISRCGDLDSPVTTTTQPLDASIVPAWFAFLGPSGLNLSIQFPEKAPQPRHVLREARSGGVRVRKRGHIRAEVEPAPHSDGSRDNSGLWSTAKRDALPRGWGLRLPPGQSLSGTAARLRRPGLRHQGPEPSPTASSRTPGRASESGVLFHVKQHSQDGQNSITRRRGSTPLPSPRSSRSGNWCCRR